MKKQEKGITLVALVITVIVMLILVSIGIGVGSIKYNQTLETSEHIIDKKIEQDYKAAVELVISEAQLKYSTKGIDKEYFIEIRDTIRESEQFKDYNAVEVVKYYKDENGEIQTEPETNIEDNEINAVRIVTKENYEIIIDEDKIIYTRGIDELDKSGPIIENYEVSKEDCLKLVISLNAMDEEPGLDKIIYYYSKEGEEFKKIEKELNTDPNEKVSLKEEKTITQAEAGKYTTYVEVYDKDGNVNQTAKREVELGHKETWGGQSNKHTICSVCGKTLSSTHPSSMITSSTSGYITYYKCKCGYSWSVDNTPTYTPDPDPSPSTGGGYGGGYGGGTSTGGTSSSHKHSYGSYQYYDSAQCRKYCSCGDCIRETHSTSPYYVSCDSTHHKVYNKCKYCGSYLNGHTVEKCGGRRGYCSKCGQKL